ncbi:MAG: 3'-5' exonuclease [Sandaracinaceae bacterium]|nr:3'-5' exonuclease [Sandaracinaceae bacterium]
MPVETSPEEPIWTRPWAEIDHVVLDVETTGTDPSVDRICDIAWERRDALGHVRARGDSLVRAGVPVGTSVDVHRIDDGMLADAPVLSSLAPALDDALRGAILVGHRIAYDLAFLDAAAGRGEIAPPPRHALDTKKLAQRCTHGISTSLRGLAEAFALPRPTHRAGPDVRATVALFDRLVGELAPHTALDLWVSQSIEGPARMRDDVREVLERAMALRRVVHVRYRVPGRAPLEAELEPWAIEGPHVEGLFAGKGRKVLRGDRILRASLGERSFVPPARWSSGLPR